MQADLLNIATAINPEVFGGEKSIAAMSCNDKLQAWTKKNKIAAVICSSTMKRNRATMNLNINSGRINNL